MIGKIRCAAERAVAADRNDTVDLVLFAVFESVSHALGGLEAQAAVGIKNGAAESGDVCNVARGEYLHVVLEKSRVAAHKTVDLNTARLSAVDDRTDGGVHSGCVSAGGKDRDFSEILFHFLFPSFFGKYY